MSSGKTFGGLYTLIGEFHNFHKHDLELVQKLIKEKLINKTHAHFINLEEHFKFETNLSEKEKDIYKKIKVKYYMTMNSSDFISFTSFSNRLVFSNQFCRVIDQYDYENSDTNCFIYLADLILNECNMEKFKKLGMTNLDVLILREKMWSFFNNNNGFTIKQCSSPLYLTQNCLNKKLVVQKVRFLINYVSKNYETKFRNYFIDLNHLFYSSLQKLKNNLYTFIKKNMYNTKSFVQFVNFFIFVIKTIENFSISKYSKFTNLDIQRRLLQILEKSNFLDDQIHEYDLSKEIFKRHKQYYLKNESINYRRWTKLEKNSIQINFSNLINFYDCFIKKIKKSYSYKDSDYFGQELNEYLQVLDRLLLKDTSENFVNALCLSYFYNISFTPLKVKRRNDLNLDYFFTFFQFLKNNYNYFEKCFLYSNNMKQFEKKFKELLFKKFPKFLNSEELKLRLRKFVLYLFVDCHFRFSDQFLIEYMLRENFKSKYNFNQIASKISSYAIGIKIKTIHTKSMKEKFWDKLANKPENVYKNELEICGYKISLKYQDFLSANPEVFIDENVNESTTWKYILQCILSRENIQSVLNRNIDFKYSVIEYILMIYLISDPTCKRVLANCLYDSKSPIPLIYAQKKLSFAYIFPLSGISLKLKNNLTKSTDLINPYFYPSIRYTFLHDENTNKNIHELLNNLFYQNSPIYKKDVFQFEKLKDSFLCSFACRNDVGNKLNFFDLSMILLQNSYLKIVCLSNNFLNFICDISNVIVVLVNLKNQNRISKIRKKLKEKNEYISESKHIFLIELIEYENIENPEVQYLGFWHKRILINKKSLSNLIESINDAILFQKSNFNLGKNLTSLKDLFKMNSFKDYEKKIFVDLHSEPIESLTSKANHSIENRLIKNNSNPKNRKIIQNAFKLQTKFHKKVIRLQKEKNLVQISKNKKIKNTFYQKKLQQLREKEFEFLFKNLGYGIIYEFIQILSETTIEERIEFLVYFENYLSIEKIRGIFQGSDNTLQLVNFFREIQKIYELLVYFIDQTKSRVKENYFKYPQKNIDILPHLVAELFLNLYPLEILNGEYLSVSQTWLKAVFKSVEKITGLTSSDLKISVLSVLGLQSSGKSTFLNNLFRLTFSSKDDKCTRGSSAVMLKINKNLIDESKYDLIVPDYLILVDTEGMGSPENLQNQLSDKEHKVSEFKDRKMLLFNMGISNMIIINSMKEFSKELKEIIQTMIVSFSDLKERNLSPKLNFVFQAVDKNGKKIREIKESMSNTMSSFNKLNFDDSENKKLFFFPSIKKKSISTEYKKAIDNYLKNLFSTKAICELKQMTSFDSLHNIIEKMNKMISTPDYTFDANFIKKREKNTRKGLFKINLKDHIQKIIFSIMSDIGVDVKNKALVQKYLENKQNKELLFEKCFYTSKEDIEKEICKKELIKEINLYLEKNFKQNYRFWRIRNYSIFTRTSQKKRQVLHRKIY